MTILQAITVSAVGTIIGGLVVFFVTLAFQKSLLRQQMDFQKKLLDQQLEFQKAQAVVDAEQRRQLHEEWRAIFKEFRNMLNTRFANLPSQIARNRADRDSTP